MNDQLTAAELLADTDSSDFEAEKLILDATELLIELMDQQGVSRRELAERIGKSKGHVSQLLSGERNMTLRTLAEIGYALGFRLALQARDLGSRSRPDSMLSGHDYRAILEAKSSVDVPGSFLVHLRRRLQEHEETLERPKEQDRDTLVRWLITSHREPLHGSVQELFAEDHDDEPSRTVVGA